MADLPEIKKLVEQHQISCVLVADTNILIDNPEIQKWAVPSSRPMFVILPVVQAELAGLKGNNRPGKPGAKQAAHEIIKLANKGPLTKGVVLPNGVFIVLEQLGKEKEPASQYEKELFQKVLGHRDMRILEFIQAVTSELSPVTVLLLTNDQALALLAPGYGVEAFLSRGPFQDPGLLAKLKGFCAGKKPSLSKAAEDLLSQVASAKKATVRAEFTLLGKEIGEESFIARGSGTVHEYAVAQGGGEDLDFEWEMLYWPYSDIEACHHMPGGAWYGIVPAGGLQFPQSEQKASLALREAISKKLEEFAHPSGAGGWRGSKTLQSPLSTVDFLFEIYAGFELSYFFNPSLPWIREVNLDNIQKLKKLIPVIIPSFLDDKALGHSREEAGERFYQDAIKLVFTSWNIGEAITVEVEYYPYLLPSNSGT